MAIKLSKHGGLNDKVASQPDILRALAQSVARGITEPIASLTDSSGGTARTDRTVLKTATLADTVASGSNLATKASSDTALLTVKDALVTLFAKANAIATALGLDPVTYNGGGTDGAGTVAAITVASTGGTTGIPAANANIMRAAIDAATYNLVLLVNRLARAVGAAELEQDIKGTWLSTVAAIAALTGSNADPGVSKVHMDAVLVVMCHNVATIAARINDIVTLKKPLVLAV